MSQMNSLVPYVSLVLVALSLGWARRNQLQWRALNAKHLQTVERLEKQLNMLSSSAIGMGQRMLLLEHKLVASQQAPAAYKSDAEDFSYSQAIQMFERGLDAATVAASCGISRSEAQLMELIRKQAKNASLAVE